VFKAHGLRTLLKCRPQPRPPYFGHAPAIPGVPPYTIFHLAVGFIGSAWMERKGGTTWMMGMLSLSLGVIVNLFYLGTLREKKKNF